MAQKYFLPCECGERLQVEVAQAGQSATCGCGRTLSVPSFRELKNLEPVPETSAGRAKRGWHPLQGAFFGIGALVMLACLAWAAYIHSYRSNLDTEERPWDNLDQALTTIERLNVEDAYAQWKRIREAGLGERQPPAFVIAREEDQRWRPVEYTLYAGAALGLVLMIVSVVIRPSATRRR